VCCCEVHEVSFLSGGDFGRAPTEPRPTRPFGPSRSVGVFGVQAYVANRVKEGGHVWERMVGVLNQGGDGPADKCGLQRASDFGTGSPPPHG
jgi:hypothetical protein